MKRKKEQRKTVAVSGGFDPVHVGHVRMIAEAARLGDVIIIANSDEWLVRKKRIYVYALSRKARNTL